MIMGTFTAIGMRAAAKNFEQYNPIFINTCGRNDTAERGDFNNWVWCNPTNRAIQHAYEDITAVSVECLWQGTKILKSNNTNLPDVETLNGNWRNGKGRAPKGAYAGVDKPLITNPGEARRKIYIPAYKRLVEHWLSDPVVYRWIQACVMHDGLIFLRDHDTGRGVDRNGPMSHAWLLCEFLNNNQWPE